MRLGYAKEDAFTGFSKAMLVEMSKDRRVPTLKGVDQYLASLKNFSDQCGHPICIYIYNDVILS